MDDDRRVEHLSVWMARMNNCDMLAGAVPCNALKAVTYGLYVTLSGVRLQTISEQRSDVDATGSKLR